MTSQQRNKSTQQRNKPTHQRSAPAREQQAPVQYKNPTWSLTGEDQRMALCRYNPTHIVKESDFEAHLRICPDARFLREFVDK